MEDREFSNFKHLIHKQCYTHSFFAFPISIKEENDHKEHIKKCFKLFREEKIKEDEYNNLVIYTTKNNELCKEYIHDYPYYTSIDKEDAFYQLKEDYRNYGSISLQETRNNEFSIKIFPYYNQIQSFIFKIETITKLKELYLFFIGKSEDTYTLHCGNCNVTFGELKIREENFSEVRVSANIITAENEKCDFKLELSWIIEKMKNIIS